MKRFFRLPLDKLGICASLFCAIHCLATPFIIALIPFLGVTLFLEESFELALLVISLLLAILSLVISYLKIHRNSIPLIIAGIGFFFFVLGKLIPLEMTEILLSVVGGCFVAFAHYRNLKIVGSGETIIEDVKA